MKVTERLGAFCERVITEELGGDDYAANAGAIASVMDRVTELETLLRRMLASNEMSNGWKSAIQLALENR